MYTVKGYSESLTVSGLAYGFFYSVALAHAAFEQGFILIIEMVLDLPSYRFSGGVEPEL